MQIFIVKYITSNIDRAADKELRVTKSPNFFPPLHTQSKNIVN